MISCLRNDPPVNWGWVRIHFKKDTRYYTVNGKSGELYWDDPKQALLVKLFFLTVVTPLYSAVYLSVHLAKGVVYPFFRIVETLVVGLGAPEGGGEHVWEELGKELPKFLLQTIWNVVKTPFYCLALEFAALYGLIWCPYEGRALFGTIEKSLHNGRSYRQDLVYNRISDNQEYLREGLVEMHNAVGDFFCRPDREVDPRPNSTTAMTWFLAFCFQVQKNLDDPKLKGVRKEAWNEERGEWEDIDPPSLVAMDAVREPVPMDPTHSIEWDDQITKWMKAPQRPGDVAPVDGLRQEDEEEDDGPPPLVSMEEEFV